MGGGDPNEKCNFFYVNGFCWQSRLSRVATTTASQQLASQQPLADLDGGISGPAEVRGPDLHGGFSGPVVVVAKLSLGFQRRAINFIRISVVHHKIH